MVWFLVKYGVMFLVGLYSGLAIGGKNPAVAAKMLVVHENTTAWLYKWAPVLYNLVKGWIKKGE